MHLLTLGCFVQLAAVARSVAAIQASAAQVASQYSLTTSTSFAFPTATQSSSDTQSFIVSEWSLSRGRIQDLGSDLAFVADPFPNGTTDSSPVLQVTYPEGSFSHNTGGSQFINLWNASDGSTFQSMLLSYEVAFDEDFDWVKGGKLPGLRGGTNTTGCSGGNKPTGLDCFSTRLMWRPNGAGEIYAYIPTPNGLCDEKSIICNDDFGISISRGAFSFVSGQWNRMTLLVQLNNPVDTANGNVQLYFNDLQVITQQDLQLRSGSAVDTDGLYFSTFFGGSDDTWATPNTTHTYFRNIQLWGGSNPSNLTGSKVTSAAAKQPLPSSFTPLILSFFLLWLCS